MGPADISGILICLIIFNIYSNSTVPTRLRSIGQLVMYSILIIYIRILLQHSIRRSQFQSQKKLFRIRDIYRSHKRYAASFIGSVYANADKPTLIAALRST